MHLHALHLVSDLTYVHKHKDQRVRQRSGRLPFIHALQDGLFRLNDELDPLIERLQVFIRDDTSDLRVPDL